MVKKALKGIGYVFAFVLLLFGGAIAYLYIQYPPEKWKAILEEQLSNQLDSAVTIKAVSYSLDGSLSLQGVKICDCDPGKVGAKSKYLLSASSVDLFFNPKSLWEKKLYFFQVLLEKPKIRIIKNWRRVKLLQKLFAETTGPPPPVFWDRITIKNGEFDWQLKKVYPHRGKYKIDFDSKHSKKKTKIVVSLKSPLGAASLKSTWQVGVSLATIDALASRLQKGKLPGVHASVQLANFRSALIQPFVRKQLPFKTLSGSLKARFSKSQWHLQLMDLSVKLRSGLRPRITGKVIAGTRPTKVESSNLQIVPWDTDVIELKKLSYDKKLSEVRGKMSLSMPEVSKRFLGDAQMNGRLTGSFVIEDGELRQADATVLNAALDVGKLELFRGAKLQLASKGRRFSLKPTSLKILGQSVRLSARGRRERGRARIDYKLEAETLDAAALVAQKLGEAGGGSGKGGQLDVAGKLSIKKLKYSRYMAQNFSAKMRYASNKVSLRDVSFAFSGGRFSGSYQLKLQAPLRHHFDLAFSGVKPNAFLDTIDSKARLYGKLSGKISGKMSGKSVAEFENSLKASATLRSSRGRLARTALQSYLKGPLGPLEDKLSDLEFQSFSTQVSASGGFVNLRHLKFTSRQVAMTGLGRAKWDGKGDLQVVLKFTDLFVQDVANPISLGISNNKLGEWYTLPFSCNGRLSEKSCWRREW